MAGWRERLKARRVKSFMYLWAWAEQELGHEPATQEFRDWWRSSPDLVDEELARFRELFPAESTPGRLNRVGREEVIGRPMWALGRHGSFWTGCPKCLLDFPSDPSESLRVRVLELRREIHLLAEEPGWFHSLRERSGLSKPDFKWLVLVEAHGERHSGICHECESPIGEEAIAICRTCRALNLNWEQVGGRQGGELVRADPRRPRG